MQTDYSPKELVEGLYIPDYKKNSIVNLSNFVLDFFECKCHYPPLEIVKNIKNRNKKKKVVLFIVDAMGNENIEQAAEHSPVLKSELSLYEKQIITSVFPTTTTAALTSLCTALPPLEHGILGYTLYLRDFSSLVNMISLSPPDMKRDLLTRYGLNPAKFLECPTIFESLQESGVKCWTITSDLFIESGLTKIHHKGSSKRSYLGMLELFHQLNRTLKQETDKTFIFVYWGLSDTYGHHYGTQSRPYVGGMEYLFKMLREEVIENMTEAEAEQTLFLISSDHGQTQTTWKDEEWIISEDQLFERHLNAPMAGEPRAIYFNVKEPEKFVEYFNQRFSKRFYLMDKETAINNNLFCDLEIPLSIKERTLTLNRSRIGDYVAIAKKNYSLHFKHHGKAYSLKGKHGSLTKDEILVPLFIYS